MIWLYAAGLVPAMIIVAYGAWAFGSPPKDVPPPPSWMPWDLDTGERPYVGQRRAKRYSDIVGAEGIGPAESLNLEPETPVTHPRTFDLEPGNRQDQTQRITWPINPPPEWPLRPPVQ